jgi:sensor histidine kinase YesM
MEYNIEKKTIKTIIRHIVLWILYIFIVYLFNIWYDPTDKFLDIFFANFTTIWGFYFAFFGLKNLFINKRIILGLFFLVVSLLGAWYLWYAYWHFLLKLIEVKPYTEYKFIPFTRTALFIYFKNFIFAIGYFYSYKAILKEQLLREIQEQKTLLETEKQHQKGINLKLEQQKLQLENAFLRSQINPHTLHNILNMLYSKSIRADAPELSEAILVLSNLMRYSLESATDANGLVPLEKELEQINNTIKINQLRGSNKFYIDFKVVGDPSQAKIIPLMLITLVENAFKYAELNEETYPLQLHITLQQNSFNFYMYNKKRTVIVHETSHGIGLENTRQRLKSAYGDDGYTIDIKQDELYYTFTLTIHYLKNNPETISNPIKKELATP